MAKAGESLAKHLRRLRIKNGLRREELAVKANIAALSLARLERGEVRNPHRNTLRALEHALDAKPGSLESFVQRVL